MKKMQNGGDTRPVQNAPKVTISPSSGSSKTPVKKTPTKKDFRELKATPSRGTMDLIRGSGDKGKYVPFTRQGRKDLKETRRVSSNEMKPSRKIMKTGGMVNSNAKVSASKVARGKVGGTSTAPKTAVPKAKYGMVMRKK
jgi:hypothetical protein